MPSDRTGANILYGVIISLIAGFYLLSRYDAPLPTGEYVVGHVTSIVPEQSGRTIPVPRLRAHIRLGNGTLIIKPISQSSSLTAAMKVNLRIYKSKLLGRRTYVLQ